MTRSIPMLGDLALDYVTWVRQRTMHHIQSLAVPGLGGDVQQGLGRASHVIELGGVLVGEDLAERLTELQEQATAGEEIAFTADITTALAMEKVVILSAQFEAYGGQPGYYRYQFCLRESPPLPEPAELSPFGGLDGFDLGFDTNVLGDIADLAGQLQDAIEAVTDVLGALDALAGLADLSLGNPLTPVQQEGASLRGVGSNLDTGGLSNLLRGGG